MKYLKKFNENNSFDGLDSIISNIESILIELKDNDIPVNIEHDSKEIKIDFGDPDRRAFNSASLPSDKFSENGKIKDYINESLKTLIDYVNEIGLFICLYVSSSNGGGHKNINYIIDATWREFHHIKTLKIVISKSKMGIY